MWYRRLLSVKPAAWVLAGLVALVAMTTMVLKWIKPIDVSLIMYAVEPVLAVGVALIARSLTAGLKDRSRHRSDKAVVIGSVIAIWFVLYFLTGVFLTFTHNSLVAGAKGVALNILAYGSVAIAMEYTRHQLLLLVGRRNAVWFGVVISVIFALPLMNLAQLGDITTAERAIKMVFVDVLPSLVASFLLTYLAIAGGLPSQLTYRLGVVAVTILPPIIPKQDWYLIGTSMMLLAVAVYLAIDRMTQHAPTVHARRRMHPRRAFDIMMYSVIVALVLFMTGLFAYRPMAVMSNSMQPVYSRGSMVIVQKVAPIDISVGDIVQYEAPDKMMTHRVIAIDRDVSGNGERIFVTKGDNSPSEDPIVHSKQIIGVVRGYIPFVGYPTVWLREITK